MMKQNYFNLMLILSSIGMYGQTAGNVGIKTATPTNALTVNGNSSIGAGYTTIAAPANGAIIQGNVGIGTSKPTNALTVNGGSSIGSGFTGIAAPYNGSIIQGNVGVGTSAPATKLDVIGKIKITDGTQEEGKVLVSNDIGVGTWRDTTGTALIVNSTIGAEVNFSGGTMRYIGASAVVTVPGYYIVSPRLITDKTPFGCGNFIAYNLSKSPTADVSPAFHVQDIHMPAGHAFNDFLYNSNIAYLTAGTYYMRVRDGANNNPCSTNISRSNFAENSFTLTLLK